MCRHFALKIPNNKYYESPVGGSHIITFGMLDTDNKASILYSLC